MTLDVPAALLERADTREMYECEEGVPEPGARLGDGLIAGPPALDEALA
ncbi:hypothetical protein [Peterkaempfera griseoplana]|nr:hypothetical protein [Peterkaempfera griseoplana]